MNLGFASTVSDAVSDKCHPFLPWRRSAGPAFVRLEDFSLHCEAENPNSSPRIFRIEGEPISQAPATPAVAAAKPAAAIPKPAPRARAKKRHYGILISFVVLVLLPLVVTVYYLFSVAEEQYASSFGFAVRSEETSLASGLLGGLAGLSGGTSSSDTDILYEFIQSRALMKKVDAKLDLTAIYSRPENDPIFAYDPSGSAEDLASYWRRMVHVGFASGSGLLEVEVKAFDPDDALAIAEAVIDESTIMINDLSAIAREDATRYAREDLDQAVTRLKSAREALTRFRSQTRIVDPSADIQGQMGLMNTLEAQLAETIIELNLLIESASDTDPRIVQLRKRIEVIETLIEKERQKFGMGSAAPGPGEQDYSTLVGEFERLMVDVEYAEKSYLAAQTALDASLAEAQRQSRYLATYARPSRPESAQYPDRFQLSAVTGGMLLLIWSIGVLIYYSLRDRR